MANKTFSTSTVTQNPFNRGMADKNAGATITITNSAGSPTIYNLSSTNSISLTSQGYYTLTTDRAVTLFTQLWGAGGAGGFGNDPSRGSAGGYVHGNVSLLPSTTYVILVGQGGRAPASTTGRSFPDGGQNEQQNSTAGGGGGSTRFGSYSQSGFNITNTSADYNNTNAVYLLIAGGGGGGSSWVLHSDGKGIVAGYGGGTNGADGGGYYANGGEYIDSPGFGGSQSAGGNGGQRGRLNFSQSGSKYYGGNGSGGGGGGGYYGGGGARGYYSQGAGGSGFINSSVIDGRFFVTTHGVDSYFLSPNPLGNRPSSTSGFGGLTGGNTGYDGAISFSLPSTTSVVSLTSSIKLGKSPETAAFSAKEIYNSGVTTNGDYWVKGSGSNPYKVFCLMDRLGGGWTRVMRIPRDYDTQDRNYYTFTEGIGYDTYSTGPFNLASSLFGNTNGTDLTVMYRVVGGAAGADFPGRLAAAMYRGFYLNETWDGAKIGSVTSLNPQYSTDGVNFTNYTGTAFSKANSMWNLAHAHPTGSGAALGDYNYNGLGAGIALHGPGPDGSAASAKVTTIYTYVDQYGLAQGNSAWQYIDIYIRKDL
jgi:hypothetical protein